MRSQALSFAETVTLKDQNHAEKERQYQAQLKSLEDENAILSEQVRFFKASLYARKTQKLSAEELPTSRA